MPTKHARKTARRTILFAGCFQPEPGNLDESNVVFVGLPSDGQSSYLRGSAQAPDRIRTAYDGQAFNAATETGVVLSEAVYDAGNLPPAANWQETAGLYRNQAEILFAQNKTLFVAGGDHAVTMPVVQALCVLNKPIHVIQIDAHPDLYPSYAGDQQSHACVAARLLEMTHVASLTQLGIRTLNPVQNKAAQQYGDKLRIHSARECCESMPPLQHIPANAPVYITLDLDAFDPGFAPGVAHRVPGGLTPRQVLNFVQDGHWQLVGMDVVELNPDLDWHDQTAILAGRLLHEGMGFAMLGPRAGWQA